MKLFLSCIAALLVVEAYSMDQQVVAAIKAKDVAKLRMQLHQHEHHVVKRSDISPLLGTQQIANMQELLNLAGTEYDKAAAQTQTVTNGDSLKRIAIGTGFIIYSLSQWFGNYFYGSSCAQAPDPQGQTVTGTSINSATSVGAFALGCVQIYYGVTKTDAKQEQNNAELIKMLVERVQQKNEHTAP